MAAEYEQAPEVTPVEKIDREKQLFDGQKADLYINTGQLGGKHFLVKVAKPDGQPMLVAIHL